MTTHREAYLAKCSEREQIIREKIKIMKSALRTSKTIISQAVQILHIPIKEAAKFSGIYENKIKLQVYRHELARLKGMDKVVVPKVKFSVPQIREWGRTGRKSYYATCKCGNGNLYSGSGERYCPNCGRLILWEKVK